MTTIQRIAKFTESNWAFLAYCGVLGGWLLLLLADITTLAFHAVAMIVTFLVWVALIIINHRRRTAEREQAWEDAWREFHGD